LRSMTCSLSALHRKIPDNVLDTGQHLSVKSIGCGFAHDAALSRTSTFSSLRHSTSTSMIFLTTGGDRLERFLKYQTARTGMALRLTRHDWKIFVSNRIGQGPGVVRTGEVLTASRKSSVRGSMRSAGGLIAAIIYSTPELYCCTSAESCSSLMRKISGLLGCA
jgi:hypothetical protein